MLSLIECTHIVGAVTLTTGLDATSNGHIIYEEHYPIYLKRDSLLFAWSHTHQTYVLPYTPNLHPPRLPHSLPVIKVFFSCWGQTWDFGYPGLCLNREMKKSVFCGTLAIYSSLMHLTRSSLLTNQKLVASIISNTSM